ncbi:MAG: MFS transporter [Candidatus Sericytochromatia bacterium]|nr:MFS transporter [Candidatus Sericytochromatia bacterium]
MKRSPLVILFVTVFLDLLGFGMIIPLLPFFGEHFGASPVQVGMLMASYSLAQFLVSPILGALSDRHGRRPVLLFTLAGSIVCMIAFGLAGSFWQLIAARALAGAFGGTVGVAQAYIADVTTPETRAKGMGMLGAAFGLGFVFGPAMGGLLSPYGYWVPSFVAAGLAAANLLFAITNLPETRQPGVAPAARRSILSLQHIGRAIGVPVLGTLFLMLFAVGTAFSAMESTFALFTERVFQYTARENGYVFAYIGVMIVIMQGGLIGRLVKRFGERALVITGLLLQAVSLAVLPISTSLPLLLITMGVLSLGSGMASPSLSSLISQHIPEAERGELLGTSQSLASLARIVGPVGGGLLFQSAGIGSPYYVGAALMGLMWIVGMMVLRSPKGAVTPIP